MPGAVAPISDPHPQSRRLADSTNDAASNAGLLGSSILGPIAARLRKTANGNHWQASTQKLDDISQRVGGFLDEESGDDEKTREKSVVSTAAKYGAVVFRKTQANAVLLFVVACLLLIFRSSWMESGHRHRRLQEEEVVSTAGSEDSCKGKRVFMYDLPPEFNVVVQDVSKCRHSLMHWMDLCPRFSKGGYGENLMEKKLVEAGGEAALAAAGISSAPAFDLSQWHDSDFYMLEMIFHHRFQSYRCLARDPAEADAFFVPYYTGLLALPYLYDREDLSTTFNSRRRFGTELIQWLEANGGEAWRRYGAVDHFLILGRTSWDFQIQRVWGTGFSALPHVANMTALTWERDANKKNEQAIPYPTAFHPKSKQKLQEWIQAVQDSNRTHLFSYVGAPRPESWSVRGIMSAACDGAGPAVCHKVDCSVVKCSHDPTAVHTSFLHSQFCLQPRGDSATRKSTFDCLISGSIPVFFHVDSAYTQYSWHLPAQAESYSVFIDEEELKRGEKSILGVLEGYSEGRIVAMRETIIGLIPNLVFVDFPEDPWAPRIEKDAFELSVERVLEKIATAKEDFRALAMEREESEIQA